eukprot:TRINITY_DN22215_c0_g1_i1.p1 TRINITY_DN22215_c0_g1~~TRINITY_DN22215_c0_g1_i1.p1  ORF type:complete len:185 (+),score=56.13 TRINITY_DN22215_c0_g1_i1:63-557(+)
MVAFNQPFEKIVERLLELQKVQEGLLATMSQESQRLNTIPFLQEISNTIAQLEPYRLKILNIKKRMSTVNDRVAKLNKRAEKLKQRRESEMVNAAEKQRAAIERERSLTAQPSKELLQNVEKKKEVVPSKDKKKKSDSSSDKEEAPESDASKPTADPTTQMETS